MPSRFTYNNRVQLHLNPPIRYHRHYQYSIMCMKNKSLYEASHYKYNLYLILSHPKYTYYLQPEYLDAKSNPTTRYLVLVTLSRYLLRQHPLTRIRQSVFSGHATTRFPEKKVATAGAGYLSIKVKYATVNHYVPIAPSEQRLRLGWIKLIMPRRAGRVVDCL